MLVGIIADTHDNLPLIGHAVDVLRERGAEALLHAGDFVAPFALKAVLAGGLQLIGVFGNNDGEREGLRRIHDDIHPQPHRFELGGRTIVLAHEPRVLLSALSASDEVGVCGHTHSPVIEPGPPLVINPGEVGAWVEGRSTGALLDLKRMQAEIIEFPQSEGSPS